MTRFAVGATATAITLSALAVNAAIVKVGTVELPTPTFVPDSVRIASGDTLRWYQIDGDHSATSGTGLADPNQGMMYNGPINVITPTFDFQFITPGSYSNFCIPHELFGMTGKVVVTPPVQGYITTSALLFSETDINIQPGETVEFYWGVGIHTLTSGTGSLDPNMGNLINSPLRDSVPAIQLTFNAPGDYPFFCIPHEAQSQSMQTTVHVANPCTCPCWADPSCDGVRSDVLDVVGTVNVGFRGFAAVTDPGCPKQRTDVDATGATDVLDVVKVVNVAFRGFSVASQYIDPCL
jgi:plastocyanin